MWQTAQERRVDRMAVGALVAHVQGRISATPRSSAVRLQITLQNVMPLRVALERNAGQMAVAVSAVQDVLAKIFAYLAPASAKLTVLARSAAMTGMHRLLKV